MSKRKIRERLGMNKGIEGREAKDGQRKLSKRG